VGFLKLALPVLLLAAAAACASPAGRPSPELRVPGGEAASVPANWQTLTDRSYGFSLRYPAGWTEKFSQPDGFHALASRRDMGSLLELQGMDYWLVAQASPREPSAGCGEPMEGEAEKSDTTLGGQPATRYVISGARGGATQHIVDVVAVRRDTCYTLQLVAGPAVPVDQAMATLREIQASYRFTR
jgi:hypothetical protein